MDIELIQARRGSGEYGQEARALIKTLRSPTPTGTTESLTVTVNSAWK